MSSEGKGSDTDSKAAATDSRAAAAGGGKAEEDDGASELRDEGVFCSYVLDFISSQAFDRLLFSW